MFRFALLHLHVLSECCGPAYGCEVPEVSGRSKIAAVGRRPVFDGSTLRTKVKADMMLVPKGSIFSSGSAAMPFVVSQAPKRDRRLLERRWTSSSKRGDGETLWISPFELTANGS